MSKEIEAVFHKIAGFRDNIDEILKSCGLEERELTYDDQEDLDAVSDESGERAQPTAEELEARRLEKQRQEESADGKTFTWLAK